MTGRDDLLRRIRRANPAPPDWALPAGLLEAAPPVSWLIDRAVAPRAPAVRLRWRGPAIAVAALAVTLAIGLPLFFISRGGEGPVATTTTTTTTTTLPTTTTTTSTELDSEAAVAWADWSMVFPAETVPPFDGGGHIINDLAGNGLVLVAVGDATSSEGNAMRDGGVWLSANGREWERVWDPADLSFGGKGLNTVVAGGPGFVMGGSSCDSVERCTSGWRGALWTSVDGRNWLRVPHDAALFGDRSGIYDLLVRPEGILALGAVCFEDVCSWAVWSSPDGRTWERVWTNETAWPGTFTAGEVGLVAVGSDSTEEGGSFAAVWTSMDGTEWQRVPHDPEVFGDGVETTGGMSDVAFGAAGFVAVGGNGNDAMVWTSADGVTWERVPHNPGVFGNASMTTVIAWGDGYLAAGPEWAIGVDLGGPVPGLPSVPSRPTIWVSPDGRTWHRIGIGPEHMVGAVRALLGFDGALLAGGQTGPFWGGGDAIWINERPPQPGD